MLSTVRTSFTLCLNQEKYPHSQAPKISHATQDWKHPLGSVHCSPPSLRAEANAAATLNQVPQGSLSPGQQYILALIRAPLFTDAPQSWILCVCVCHPQDPGDLPGCPHPALSALSKTLSLTEGWPLYQQTIHLIRELRNLSPLPKSALDLGSSIYRVLINCVLHCTAYDKTIL